MPNKHSLYTPFVWMRDRLVPFEQAVFHFWTLGLHFGMGWIEGIRCYNTPNGPVVFRLRDHIQRLVGSAKIFGIRHFPLSLDDMVSAVKETILANEMDECYIRPLLVMENEGWDLNLADATPVFTVAVRNWKNYFPAEKLANGLRVNISSFQRNHSNIMMAHSKCAANYATSFLAKGESRRHGYDDAISLGFDGFVTECSGACVFVVFKDDVLCTPPIASQLDGITRDTVVTIAKSLSYEVREMNLTRDMLYTAKGVFLAGTAMETPWVTEIDGRIIGDGKIHTLAEALRDEYSKAVRGMSSQIPKEWCDYL